jgi:putative membrane protein
MLLSLSAAALHHWLAFLVAALLAAELAILTPQIPAARLRLLGRIDLAYGLSFGLLVAVGLLRAVATEKGWGFYAASLPFWCKMAVLAAITLLSLPPTVRYIRWQRQGHLPDAAEVAATRRFLWAEAALFPVVMLAAAAMARGF